MDKTYTVNASSVAANGIWKLKVQDKAASGHRHRHRLQAQLLSPSA